MGISSQEVEHVANLARLELSPEQIEIYAGHLNNILTYMAKLAEVNTEGLEPTYHAVGTVNAFREDEVKESLERDQALANAPASDRKNIIVPKVI